MKRLIYILMALCVVGAVSCKKNDPEEAELEEVITMPDAVDIGLVIERGNGTTYRLKWANFNLGASAEWERGYHYAWGETKRKQLYDWTNYKFSNGEYDKLTGYCTTNKTSFWDSKKKPKGPDGLTQLLDVDDVAHVKLGGKWRMPTGAEFEALFALAEEEYKDQYDWVRNAEMQDLEGNITYGLKITQKSTGNYVFFPYAQQFEHTSLVTGGSHGYYWSSSLSQEFPSSAICIKTSKDEIGFLGVDSNSRYLGCSIRPVCEE